MTKRGRAVVYDAPNTPFVIREYPVRDAKPDEVLVRITMSTICRSDIHSYLGHRSSASSISWAATLPKTCAVMRWLSGIG